ncbi:MAG: Ig-like domain-containing protein [Clostridiales bacterium]|nr:Ig-like domain-containing protein [Clostridiales bacterium]
MTRYCAAWQSKHIRLSPIDLKPDATNAGIARIGKGWFDLRRTTIKETVSFCFLCLLFVIPNAGTAFASSGSDEGGGRGEPLVLVETSIVDGQMEAEGMITLTFSNNVINESVRENNRRSLSLYDERQNEIPIEVLMADEQIQPDAKRDISVKPAVSLTPGAVYTLVVSQTMQAKNGAYTDKVYSIAFSVTDAGAPVGASDEAAAPITAPGSGDSAEAASLHTPGSADPSQPASERSTSMRLNAMSIVMFVCAGLALCALIVVLRLRKRPQP